MPSVSVEGERKATVGSPVELKLALFVIYRYRISIVYILTLLKNIDIDMVIIENIDILLIEYQIFISILNKLANFKNIDRFGVGGRSPPSSLTETICENVDPFLSFIKWQNNPKYGNVSRNFHIYLTAWGISNRASSSASSGTVSSSPLMYFGESICSRFWWVKIF